MVVLYCIIYNIYIPLYNIIFTIIMVAQKSIVNYPNYHGLILGDGLFISLSTRVTLDLQTIYIYNIYLYPYIPIYLHMYTEYIYIYYIHTPISLHMTYIPNPPGGSFDGTSVARCHGRSHKCAVPPEPGRWLGKCWDFCGIEE
jgi:hypothetical protein